MCLMEQNHLGLSASGTLWGTSQNVPQECLPSLGDIGVFSLIIAEDFLWVGNYTPVPPNPSHFIL